MVRTAETPMDFEWQSHAPMDESSPFFKIGRAHDKKRPFSAFDSPGKKPLPSLRAPNSQPFLFNQPGQATQNASVFGQPAFMTPRKVDVDFSSGAETSPENANNEDTPEQPARTEKGSSSSLFQMQGQFAPSPGRGQIPRAPHYSNVMVHKIQKRRQRDKALGRQVRADSDDESDRPSSGDGKGKSAAQKREQTGSQPPASRISSFSEFFALLEAHPNVPGILSWWAQLVVNLSLFSLAVYVVFTFVSAIRAEFEQAAEEVSDTILAEMATCAKSYVDNKCGGNGRLPALETVCENWERCMNRDPAKVGRAKVSAHTMALIINSFIDPISWKAILFFLATISTFTVVSNWSFRSFRNRYNQQGPAQHYNPQHDPSLHGQPLHLQNNPAYGYYGHQDPRQTSANGYADKENVPLMLEDSLSMDYVNDRSRERESHLRTPSPSKRRFA
ncbi:hypothetical protein N7492_009935 [Penicillium capsulatum]|uniref:Brl1/Brr6 domain-containing protein n=1 Tax=Penicillium capsulatum TaxID=69766 RepID=A0A9W9LEY8_9EURO|nr:hypothetical protein N7492_009935 [Penicillium capsulatum]KAJ6112446.1 hypothetical protein N7512_007770 [Penicillium capsulatum]